MNFLVVKQHQGKSVHIVRTLDQFPLTYNSQRNNNVSVTIREKAPTPWGLADKHVWSVWKNAWILLNERSLIARALNNIKDGWFCISSTRINMHYRILNEFKVSFVILMLAITSELLNLLSNVSRHSISLFNKKDKRANNAPIAMTV